MTIMSASSVSAADINTRLTYGHQTGKWYIYSDTFWFAVEVVYDWLVSVSISIFTIHEVADAAVYS